MSFRRKFQNFLICATAAFCLGTQATAQSTDTSVRASTILVFDVSNSMWGQIDGVSKIEIAREVIGDLVRDWDEGTDLGLVAYGHRRKSDCGDIQEVISVGPVDGEAFATTVNGLVPRGRTPLTDAVRQAADLLNYRDVPSTVILVSDGIESCNADPCALAQELERGGIDFTAHVVGFDVAGIADQGQLSCLADETGGKYLTADNADELADALEVVAAAPPPMLTLEAVAVAGGQPILDASIRWTLVALDAETSLLDGDAMARPSVETGGGKYFARAELDGRVGSLEFAYPGGENALYQVVLAVPVTLTAPDEVETGAGFDVIWTGPNAGGDFIALATQGADAMQFADYSRTSGGSPSAFTAPDEPGGYLLRYVSAVSGKVLAERPILVTGGFAEIEAPPVVEAGSNFEVIWSAPGEQNDFIAIVPADSDDRQSGNYAYTRHGNPAIVKAQDTPGAYEVRYVSGRSRSVLARLAITVVPVAASLEAAPTAVAGSEVSVTWLGPDNQNDFVSVAVTDASGNKYEAYTYTRHGNPAKVRMPDDPGTYELRYITGQDKNILVTLPITVMPAASALEAPPTAVAGSEVPVSWTGPDNQNDYISVAKPDVAGNRYETYSYTRHGNPAKVRMPDEPGTYELRYVTGQDRKVLATLPITITGADVSLESPPVAGAGLDIPVDWVGPDNKNDFIEIVPAGSDENARGTYAYTRHGSPAKVRAPDQAGAYELRYKTGQDRKTLAAIPITVTEVQAALEAPPVANAGAHVPVSWTGPDTKNDYVVVVPADSDADTRGTYAYTRHGDPAQVRVPDEPGSYEFRYVTGQSKRVLASLLIEVVATPASLEAAPVAEAGIKIEVLWTGPDNKNDFIAIAVPGDEGRKRSAFAYTRHGNPATVEMPETPGTFELRYVTGQDHKVLERLPIVVR